MSGEAGVDPALVEVLAAHLEPWWRCAHPQPMGSVWSPHECRRCESERDDVGAALAAVLEPYVQQRVAAALREAAADELVDDHDLADDCTRYQIGGGREVASS